MMHVINSNKAKTLPPLMMFLSIVCRPQLNMSSPKKMLRSSSPKPGKTENAFIFADNLEKVIFFFFTCCIPPMLLKPHWQSILILVPHYISRVSLLLLPFTYSARLNLWPRQKLEVHRQPPCSSMLLSEWVLSVTKPSSHC